MTAVRVHLDSVNRFATAILGRVGEKGRRGNASASLHIIAANNLWSVGAPLVVRAGGNASVNAVVADSGGGRDSGVGCLFLIPSQSFSYTDMHQITPPRRPLATGMNHCGE